MNYLFPIAFLLNSSAITFLLIAAGLLGQSELAAEIGVIHASALALFFAFSANARNVILGQDSALGAEELLRVRILLVVPLAVLAFYLVDSVIEIDWLLVVFIIVRRSLDWLVEIGMSEMERTGDTTHIRRYVLIQTFALVFALLWLMIADSNPYAGIYFWCLSPLLTLPASILAGPRRFAAFSQLDSALLPHFGSTAIIGIGVYVFRVVIVLLVGKAIAGDLFTAFSIGGVVGATFASSVGPSMILREQKGEGRGFPLVIRLLLGATVLGGGILVLLGLNDINLVEAIHKSLVFQFATGLSMIGGAIMVAAQMVRLRIIQLGGGANVFGADVLMNIILITSIPFTFFIMGREALASLYLFSAILAYGFYQTFHRGLGIAAGDQGERYIRAVIVFLLLMPVFFKLDGTLFVDRSYQYDSLGQVAALPLPVSLLACLGGLLLMGRYTLAHRSLTVLFMTFVLMTMSVFISSPDMTAVTQGKFILLIQFILPFFALVLGEIIEGRGQRQVVEKVFLVVLVLVVPVQVLLTLNLGNPLLIPHVGLFSIYQHLQYVPVIFVSAYLLALFTLYDVRTYRLPLVFLSPFMGVYAGASYSRLAIFLLVSGVIVFVAYAWRNLRIKWLLLLWATIVVVSPFVYLDLYQSYATYDQKFSVPALLSDSGSVEQPRTGRGRTEYWRYYSGRIAESGSSLLFGHAERPDRREYPSAHNYYLDFIYNFGLAAILPFLYLGLYTARQILLHRRALFRRSVLGLALVTLYFIVLDSNLKVGFRQPYPGIFMYFVWGVLLSRLSRLSEHRPGNTAT